MANLPAQWELGWRAQTVVTCGRAYLVDLPWFLCTCACRTPKLRPSSAQPLGVVNVIYEMFQTLTKSLSFLALQDQQLHRGETHQLLAEMGPQGHQAFCLVPSAYFFSASTGPRTGLCS